MIGKLIPAGTGMRRYSGINVDYGENEARIFGSEDPEFYGEEPEDETAAASGETQDTAEAPAEEPVVYGETVILE